MRNCYEVPPRTPLLFVESVTWNGTGQSFDCYQTWLRTDRMKIEIEVVAGPPLAALALERGCNAAG